jgi:hypothetical protein
MESPSIKYHPDIEFLQSQHFDIVDLDELTNERFGQETKRQEEYEALSAEMMSFWAMKNIFNINENE